MFLDLPFGTENYLYEAPPRRRQWIYWPTLVSTIFRLGPGGKVGSGQPPFPWIHMDDLLNAFLLAMNNQQMSGVYNLVAPEMTTNLEFTRAFARVLKRPAFLSLPGWVLEIVFGESSVALTEGQKVLPERLLNAGFKFAFPDIQSAWKDLFSSHR